MQYFYGIAVKEIVRRIKFGVAGDRKLYNRKGISPRFR